MIIGSGISVLTYYHVSTWAIAEQPHSRCGMVSSVLWHNVHVRSNHRSCCFFTQCAFVRASCCKMPVVVRCWCVFTQYNIRSIFPLCGWVEVVLRDVAILPTLCDVVANPY